MQATLRDEKLSETLEEIRHLLFPEVRGVEDRRQASIEDALDHVQNWAILIDKDPDAESGSAQFIKSDKADILRELRRIKSELDQLGEDE